MLHLTDGVGLVVTTTGGSRLGVVRDFVVRAGGELAPVTEVLFGEPEQPTVGLPWSATTAVTPAGITVADDITPDPMGEGITIEVDDDELLLARDVLDTRVVDVPGRFLVRVADIPLVLDLDLDVGPRGHDRDRDISDPDASDPDTSDPDGRAPDGRHLHAVGPSGAQLVATGIELSTAGKLNRGGFERLGGRQGQRFVPWADLHLTSVRGRAALMATHTPLLDLPPADLARVLPKLSSTHVGEVLAQLAPGVLAATVTATPPGQLRHLLDGLPPALVDRVLAAVPPSRAATIRRALRDAAISRARLAPRHRHP
jgi:hypothetical protein